jgi:hypothetical protein
MARQIVYHKIAVVEDKTEQSFGVDLNYKLLHFKQYYNVSIHITIT